MTLGFFRGAAWQAGGGGQGWKERGIGSAGSRACPVFSISRFFSLCSKVKNVNFADLCFLTCEMSVMRPDSNRWEGIVWCTVDAQHSKGSDDKGGRHRALLLSKPSVSLDTEHWEGGSKCRTPLGGSLFKLLKAKILKKVQKVP